MAERAVSSANEEGKGCALSASKVKLGKLLAPSMAVRRSYFKEAKRVSLGGFAWSVHSRWNVRYLRAKRTTAD